MRNCIICKTNQNYYAKGKCIKCYQLKYNSKYENKKRRNKNQLKYYHKKYSKTQKWNNICRQNMRKMRAKKYFNLTIDEYDELTNKCCICGFSLIVELHHKDKDKSNNNLSNLIGLCPNHHRMVHMNLIKF